MRGSVNNTKEKAKHFAKELVAKIEDMIDEHNQKVQEMNNKPRKADKIIVVKGDPKADEEFYMYAADAAQKLKMLSAKVSEAEKIKKQRRDNYEYKIGQIISCIEDAVDKEQLALSFDHETIKWAQQMGNLADQVSKTLSLLQKESGGFCFGGNKNTINLAEKGLVDIISYHHFWLMLTKVRPLLHKEIHSKYMPLTYEESIFFDIDKMIVNEWPEAEVVEVPVEVEKVVEKVIYRGDKEQSKLMLQNSFKEQIERRELNQKCQKLMRDLSYQKQLREAHQMLVGLGRPQNISKAIETYRSIPEISQSDAKQSIKSQTQLRINPLICNILGCLYEEGKFLPRDLKKAVEFYIKSASVEDAEGLYKIGNFLEKNLVNSSQLFEQHYASRREQIRDAIEHYEKAAEKGHLDAITDLGHIYENGIKINSVREQNSVVSNSDINNPDEASYIFEPNLNHAIKYYLLAKKQNFPRALNNLGALYVRTGDKLSQTMKGSNIQRGLKYLRKAADLRYPKAYLNLGKCYENGLGVKINEEKARAMYIDGAELGDTQCKLQMVKFTIINQGCTGKEAVRVAQYLRQIVVTDPDNAQALYLTGLLYEKGLAVDKNPEIAYHFITRSAKLDYGPAQVKLGDYYYSGYFVQRNLIKARHHYQKASSQGNSQGYINLALLYAKGELEGDRTDQLEMANRCLLQAAKLGDANAFIFMNKQTKKDKEIIRHAAQLGSQDAMKMLAKTSSTGTEEVKSIEKVKDQYGVLLNRMVREVAKSPVNKNEIKSGRTYKRTERIEGAPLSQKERQMMLYSPRSRVTDQSNAIFKIKYNSPQTMREGSNPRQFLRSR